MVPGTGLEPVSQKAADFKPAVFTDFTIPAAEGSSRQGGNRTRTICGLQILSLARLPIPPLACHAYVLVRSESLELSRPVDTDS